MTVSMTAHEFTIKRLGVTQGASGGQIRAYTLANRLGNPTSAKGRAIVMTAKEKNEHGVRGDILGWKLLIPTIDPKIELNDQVTFTYIDGQTHTIKILVPSFARSADGRFYKVIGQEDSSE